MTQTIVESKTKTTIIGFDQPFCVIGERINPTGRKKLAAELEAGDFSTVEKDALAQGRRGHGAGCERGRLQLQPRSEPDRTAADAQNDRNGTGAGGRAAVHRCSVPGALEAGLEVCEGRPLLNSVTGEEERLEEILPLVKKFGVPVVAISNDDTGISSDVRCRGQRSWNAPPISAFQPMMWWSIRW